MSYKIGTATDYLDLLNVLETFLTAQGMAGYPADAGTGNGVISGLIGGASSVAESFAVTATDATHFSVVGSISGSLGTATAGTPFTHAKLNFTITAGGTAFIAGDVFSFLITPPWTISFSSSDHRIWKAPGNSGTEAIFVGVQPFFNTSGAYYNWNLNGFTGYDSTNALFTTQPGAVQWNGFTYDAQLPILTLWNSSIPYWIVANGRRVMMLAKVSTVYVQMYLGYILPYPSPGQYPYPLFVGGNLAWEDSAPAVGDARWGWAYAGAENANFYQMARAVSAERECAGRLRTPAGHWLGFDGNWANYIGSMWPYNHGAQDVRPNLDGSYPLLPVILSDGLPNIYGELDGLLWTTGFGASPEDTVTIGNAQYVFGQNVFRANRSNFHAMRLQ